MIIFKPIYHNKYDKLSYILSYQDLDIYSYRKEFLFFNENPKIRDYCFNTVYRYSTDRVPGTKRKYILLLQKDFPEIYSILKIKGLI